MKSAQCHAKLEWIADGWRAAMLIHRLRLRIVDRAGRIIKTVTILVVCAATALPVGPVMPWAGLSNQWLERSGSSAGAKDSHKLAWDMQSGRIIMFGGHASGDPGDQTWAYDYRRNAWMRMSPAPRPPAMAEHTMTYDVLNDRVIIHGSPMNVAANMETWAYDFDSDTWTNRNPNPRPTTALRGFQYAWPRMTYDSRRGQIVHYQAGETWTYEYSSNRWTNRTNAVRPNAVTGYELVYDAHSDRVVLFGGSGLDFQPRNESWLLDPSTYAWTQKTPANRPQARIAFGLVYDEESGRVILFGGTGLGSRDLSDTWAYDVGTDQWLDLTSASSPNSYHHYAMVYLADIDRTILYGGNVNVGGLNHTWEYLLTDSSSLPPMRR